MRVAVFDRLSDRLTVSHLRLTYFELNTISTTQNVDLDVQVKFAHTLKNGLARIFVCFNAERWIFCNHLTDRDTHLL